MLSFFFFLFLMVTSVTALFKTVAFAGIDLVTQAFPPITACSPITVSPPKIVALA